jgi:hypothetical protein
MKKRTVVIASLGITTLATLTSLSPANAAAAPKPELQLDGFGTYELDSSGQAVVSAPGEVFFKNQKKSFDAVITAVLTADDGTLPEPEACESASATFTVAGGDKASMTLSGTGLVCAEFPQEPTSIVTHVFTGRYTVDDAANRKVVDTDGFFEIRLGLGNVASAFAIDT